MTRFVNAKYGYISAAAPVQTRRDQERRPVTVPADLSRAAVRQVAAPGRVRVTTRNHGDVEAAPVAHELGCRRGTQPCPPAGTFRFADNDTGDIAQARIFDQSLDGRRAIERDRLGAERFGKTQHVDAPVAFALG